MSRARRRQQEAPELDITTFLNLMVVLIPFLLVTAVFSRITIQELNMPEAAAGGRTPDKPVVTIEVIVRQAGLEIADGKRVVMTIPRKGESQDFEELSRALLDLKREYSEKEDATILIEPDITYEELIHVMDAVKVAELPGEEDGERKKYALFPELSIGEAP